MRWLLVLVVFLASLGAVSCGSSPHQNSSNAQIRVMTASPDLGNVDVQVNGQTIATNLGWRSVFPMPTTSYANAQAGSLHVQEFPTGVGSPALVDARFSTSPNNFYTILTAGEQSSGALATIMFSDDHIAPTPGQLRLRFVNAASTVGTIDVYFTAGPNDPVPVVPSLPAFSYKSVSSYILFSGSSTELCANPAGVIPSAMGRCLLSVQLQFLAQPKNSLTFFLLDPYIPPNPPVGSFTTPVVLGTLPY